MTEINIEALQKENAELKSTVDSLRKELSEADKGDVRKLKSALEESNRQLFHYQQHGTSAPSVRQKPDLSNYKGKYRMIGTNGVYGLWKREKHEVSHGHTHHAKNDTHSWQGTAEQFREKFEKI